MRRLSLFSKTRRPICVRSIATVGLFMIALLSVSGAAMAQNEDDSSGLASLPLHRVLSHAEAAMTNERYDDAIRYYDHARRERPGDPAIPYNMGIASYRLGLYDQAASLFSIAGAMSDDSDLRSRASINEGTSRYQQSLAAHGDVNPDALPIDPEEQEKLKAELGESIEHLRESIRKYRAALQENPRAEAARANAELASRRIRHEEDLIRQIEELQQRQQQQEQGDDEQDEQNPQEQQDDNEGEEQSEENQHGQGEQGQQDENEQEEQQQGQQQQDPEHQQQQDPQDADQDAPSGGEQNPDQDTSGEQQQGEAMQGDGSTGDGEADAQSDAQMPDDQNQQQKEQEAQNAEAEQDNRYELSQDELDRWLQFAREQERRRQQQQAKLRQRSRPRVRKDW